MWLALALVLLITYICYTYVTNKEYKRLLSRIPSEKGLPFFGHALELGRNDAIIPALERMWNKFGRDRFRIQVGPTHQVVLAKPEDIETILTSNTLIKKNKFYDVFHGLIGKGLVTSHGNHWRSHRKLLTPAFHFKTLESYYSVMMAESTTLMRELRKMSDQEFDAYTIFNQVSLVTMIKLSLGADEAMLKELDTYSKHIKLYSKLTTERMFSFWKYIDCLYFLTSEGKQYKRCIEVVYNKNKQILDHRREHLKYVIDKVNSGEETMESFVNHKVLSKNDNFSFIELLLLSRTIEGESLSEKSIMDEINTFTFAGQETLTITASFALYVLSTIPEVQEKVFTEQMEITNGDIKSPVLFEDLAKMKYLDRVIKEVLRMYSPVAIMGREVTEPVTLADGIVLPVGCDVVLAPYLSHRNPDLFPDPEKFDPDRFLKPLAHHFLYYPFSAGPRNCIGQKLAIIQLKVWLATIVRSLKLSPSKNLSKPKLVLEVALKSSTGINIKISEQ